MDQQTLTRRITSNLDREFLYLERHMPPEQAAHVKALGIPGVYLLREYRRYYPAGEVSGHMVGFTTVDDKGQEGLELGFDQLLNGEDGSKRVIQDLYGRYVENVESIRSPRPGRDLVTSIDLRIQYLAYRELKAAMQEYQARAGSVIVVDVDTGEVLAMVNQPSYNPNDREQLKPGLYRNRAATDIFEPGSSVKPFIMAAALASGQYRPDSVVDTSPGFLKVGNTVEEDEHNFGAIDMATILAKSSNVGIAKVALSLKPEQIYSTLTGLGLGQVTGSGYPGESAGVLGHYSHWRPIGIATLSHGYGLSVTPLQLAHAYATIGAGGVKRPISFERVAGPVPGEQVMDPKVGARAGANDGAGGREGRHRDPRFADRVSSIGKNRHGVQIHRGGLFDGQNHGGICRLGARFTPEIGDGGGDRRAEPGLARGRHPGPRRHGGGAGVRQRDVGRPAPDGRTAG